MPDPDISFDAFVADLRKSVDAFEQHWRERSTANPEHYPMAMWPGDWFEQFIAFDSMQNED